MARVVKGSCFSYRLAEHLQRQRHHRHRHRQLRSTYNVCEFSNVSRDDRMATRDETLHDMYWLQIHDARLALTMAFDVLLLR